MLANADLRSDLRPERKWRRTLRELLARSGSTDERAWLNRFLAERICSDHTLPSTVCDLARKGLAFERKEIEVAGYAGAATRITAYRVAPESIERAQALLAGVQ
jgi:hypothetical protein